MKLLTKIKVGFSSPLLLSCALLPTVAPTARADAPKTQLFGTITSIRGNILVVRPSLRPKLTRVAFSDKTAIMAYERAAPSMLKPGMRIELGGRYSEQEGLHPFYLLAADKPMGELAEKSNGITIDKQQGWAQAVGTIKSVQPFVFTDDNGKEYTARLETVRMVLHAFPSDRNSLLIGVRIRVTGTTAPDGVIQAESISPDKNFAKVGTMFGEITAVRADGLEIRPRYTSDAMTVTVTKNCVFQRQIDLDPDSFKVGDTVTFWGQQRNHPGDMPRSDDLLAIALLVGNGRYPASEGNEGGVFLTGKLASLDPVKLALPDGKTINVIIPAQMPIARLESISPGDIKPGAQVMLVLSRRPDGSFQTSTVIVDASPWVGYGG